MFPLSPPTDTNRSDYLISLTGHHVSFATNLCIASWRDQNQGPRIRTVSLNRGIDGRRIVGTIGHHRCKLVINLSQQSGDLSRIARPVGWQRRRKDITGVGIDNEIQLAPRAAFGYRRPISRSMSLKTTRYHDGTWATVAAVHQGRTTTSTLSF